ncbi:uncharacterized protein NDAI_0G06190 [Naumovozyma dairenensis CBS 421]|uniref:Phospholipase C/D domain-containing protein n=1 Tax=Naumovozyma dairenensis (strain ATCC 10597 / BCRC 20456 / CBS 421 / NBRC 0211 / NRRL Y-12639) TaxID=1071378 RepID=J7RTN6_NAUDC|nr:hypothetical protein NDAI_0G06190 [Naumovozyma dairenensis CBS 421]CCK73602.1 hypothetical protein NDAI_0G06190 [Naumovozyma dairenensis CBS 421]
MKLTFLTNSLAILYFVFYLSLWLTTIHAAGVITHLTLLARSAPDNLKRTHYSYLKAGSFFPDALYNCDPNNADWKEFAEFTHWPPFLHIGIQLWSEKYKHTPNSMDSLNLKSLLLGVFIHQIVDTSWHSLVPDWKNHGLLKVISELEFNGDVDNAHNFIDIMGEFIQLSKMARISTDNNDIWDFYLEKNWPLPKKEDVEELIERSGFQQKNIDFQTIKRCLKTGETAINAEISTFKNNRNNLLNVAYGLSPRSGEFLQDYWLGGEFNLISTLRKCVPVFQSLFNHYQDVTKEDFENEIKICNNQEINKPYVIYPYRSVLSLELYKDNHLYISPMIPFSNFGSSLTLGRFMDDNEQYLAVGAPLENSQGSIYLIPWSIFTSDQLEHTQEITHIPMVPMYGSAVHSFPLYDFDFLVVSEPGLNSIRIFRGLRLVLVLRDSLTSDASQLTVSQVLDIKGDGIPDLLLSGMYYGDHEEGRVFIIRGMELLPYLFSNHDPIYLEITKIPNIMLQDNYSQGPYHHFGSSMAVSFVRMNNDAKNRLLYITAQSQGIVYVYELNTLNNTSLPKFCIQGKNITSLDESTASAIKKIPSRQHGMFGVSFCTWQSGNDSYVAISQHLFDRVFIYRENNGSIEYYLTLALKVTVDPVKYKIGFGSSIEYDHENNVMFISSPGIYDDTGAIWKIPMTELENAFENQEYVLVVNKKLEHLHLINPRRNSKGSTHFGKTMFLSHDHKLVIGIPHDGYGSLGLNQLVGSVMVV